NPTPAVSPCFFYVRRWHSRAVSGGSRNVGGFGRCVLLPGLSGGRRLHCRNRLRFAPELLDGHRWTSRAPCRLSLSERPGVRRPLSALLPAGYRLGLSAT